MIAHLRGKLAQKDPARVIVDVNGQTLSSVREMPVKSVIAWPAEGQVAPAIPITLVHGPLILRACRRRTWMS